MLSHEHMGSVMKNRDAASSPVVLTRGHAGRTLDTWHSVLVGSIVAPGHSAERYHPLLFQCRRSSEPLALADFVPSLTKVQFQTRRP